MDMDHLGPAERASGIAVGPVGKRNFYLTIEAGGRVHVLACDKEQIAALGITGLQIIEQAGIQPDEDVVRGILGDRPDLGDDVVPTFRVGSMAVALDTNGVISMTIEEQGSTYGIEFIVTPEQLRAMALAALETIEAGRPICPWCQLPKDPEGHRCPSTNGHHVD